MEKDKTKIKESENTNRSVPASELLFKPTVLEGQLDHKINFDIKLFDQKGDRHEA